VGQPYSVGPFAITVVGSLQADVTQYLTEKLVYEYSSGNFYWGPACDANAPVSGAVGEIQSSDSYSMMNGQSPSGPEHSYMQYAPGIVQLQTGATSNAYTFTSPAFSKIFTDLDLLPFYDAGDYWTSEIIFNGNNAPTAWAFINVASPPALLVTVETTSNITFSRTVDLVCPLASFVSSSGCYECEVGVTLIFSVQSLCSPGFVAISTNSSGIGVYTQSLSINNTAYNYAIGISTQIAQNDICIQFTGNGGSQSVCISFTASFYTPQSPPAPSNNGTNVPQKKSCGFACNADDFFKNVFNGVAKWWEYIIFVIFFIICIVLLVIFFPLFVWMFKGLYSGVRWITRKVKRTPKDYKKTDDPKDLPTTAYNQPISSESVNKRQLFAQYGIDVKG
jgi:hypothetical protein